MRHLWQRHHAVQECTCERPTNKAGAQRQACLALNGLTITVQHSRGSGRTVQTYMTARISVSEISGYLSTDACRPFSHLIEEVEVFIRHPCAFKQAYPRSKQHRFEPSQSLRYAGWPDAAVKLRKQEMNLIEENGMKLIEAG
eukprot:scaffold346407_cov19-Prasinocladus_malaysianus.AAC.1